MFSLKIKSFVAQQQLPNYWLLSVIDTLRYNLYTCDVEVGAGAIKSSV
jgi:hypothetical protein